MRVAGLRADAIAIAVGDGHSCALTASEGLRCWGYNGWGQLGDGTDVNRLRPVAVSGLRRGVTAVAAGARHTCARTATGNVRCWGYNLYSQLGDGIQAETRLQPGYVVGLGVATATLSIRSRSTKVGAARLVAIELRCGRSGACRGVLSLSARAHSPQARVTVRLGAHAFAIPARSTQQVEIKLTRRGLKLLGAAKRLPVRARATFGQPDGTASETSRRITLTGG